ncbi:MAG: retron St85 family effector protein [Clostridium butyricum]
MKQSKYINDVLSQIYNEIYSTISTKTSNIFLCGSSLESSINCFYCQGYNSQTMLPLRKRIKEGLEKDKRIKILFAENLFRNLVDIQNDYDFLQLENMLADDKEVDVVIIILESVGAFVELGAFTNIKQLREKLLVVVNKKFQYDESFVNLGPIKILQKMNSNHIIYTDGDISNENIKSIRKFTKKNNDFNELSLSSIMTLYYFLQIYFNFFSPISIEDIKKHILFLDKNIKDDIHIKLNSALNLLKRDGIIKQNSDFSYMLTKEGFDLVTKMKSENKLKFSDRYIFDKLRTSILNDRLRINN